MVIPAEPAKATAIPQPGMLSDDEAEEAKEHIFSQTIWASIPAAEDFKEPDSPDFNPEEFSIEEPVYESPSKLSPQSQPPVKLVIEQNRPLNKQAISESRSKDELTERVRQLEDQNIHLLESFAEMQKHYRSENWQLHQRMSALEEMLSTMNQLFDAKIRHAMTQRLV